MEESELEMTTVEESQESRQLAIRKKCELDIISKYDRRSILLGGDCWYLIDSNWLNAWHAFVKGENEPPPGPISSKDLLDSTGAPLPNLKNRIDYRAVSPLVYFIFIELHGKDSNYPDIPRYVVDIYKPQVPPDRLVNIQMRAIPKAQLKVNKIRPQWMNWEVDYGEDDEEEGDKAVVCCCCISREHLANFIYWMVHCWSYFKSRKNKETQRNYSQYRPLHNNAEEMEMNNSTHSSNGQSATSNQQTTDATTADPDAPKVEKISYFTKIKNNLTRQWANRENDENRNPNNNSDTATSRARAMLTRPFRNNMNNNRNIRPSRPMVEQAPEEDDDVDESDNDYEGVEVGTADKHHESGQWLNKSIQAMSR